LVLKDLLNNDSQNIPLVVITGVPRSGTSIVGRILDLHPQISTWVEPYYIWDHHFRSAPHDERTADDATQEVQRWIRKAFHNYRKILKTDIVADKSPRLCLKIPFVRKVFPEARYIFMLRDGRDTILSIWHQWQRKGEIFGDTHRGSQWQNRLYIVKRWLGRRPTWQFRIQSIIFELGSPLNWPQKKFLNKIRWGGRFGWGPRFKGWQDMIGRTTPLEFSALQWVHCARGIMDNIDLIPEDRRIILKYEEFIIDPQTSIRKVLDLLNLNHPEGFMSKMPPIWSDNSNKWLQAFSAEERRKIGSIIGQTLIDFGYARDESWYAVADRESLAR
jgi:hypothetical protein